MFHKLLIASAVTALLAVAGTQTATAGVKVKVKYNFTSDSAASKPSYRGKLTVAYDGPEKAGTIIVNTSERRLYFVLENGKAIQYGVGVGREGFEWTGTSRIARRAKWPSWRPPASMRKREPDLPVFMKGGPDNPLGARALYLYQGKRDTLYRIHGTAQPRTIGLAVSSGCIRMLNDEVIDLYERITIGSKVIVL